MTHIAMTSLLNSEALTREVGERGQTVVTVVICVVVILTRRLRRIVIDFRRGGDR